MRAAKARAIFRTFHTPEAVAGMAVEEAYDHRERKPRRATRESRRRKRSDHAAGGDRTARLAAFLEEVSVRAEELVDVAAFAEQEHRQKLFPVLRRAIDRLKYLGQLLGADDEVPLDEQASTVPDTNTLQQETSHGPLSQAHHHVSDKEVE